ncbi:MAG: universal stress protein [bacterium]|nr:universal stress protein [bacterium]
MFKKILCADDLSERALMVLKTALELSRKTGAELTILNIREDFLNKEERVMLRVDLSDFKDDMTKTALAVRDHIDKDAESLGYKGSKYQVLLREGKPSREIIAVANELDADIIIVGLFGSSILKDKLFGSTAENLCSHVKRTVLTVWNGD